MCPGWRFGGHHLLRALLALIILSVVFAMGVKLGELKGMFGSEGFYGQNGMRGGRSLMMRGYPGGDYFPAGGGMMNWGTNNAPQQATTTVQ